LRYPAVELACALLFLASAVHFVVAIVALKYCVFSFLLLALIFTDLDHQLLPDVLTLPGALVGVVFAGFVYVEGFPGLVIFPQTAWQARGLSVLHAVIGAIVGAGLVYLVGEAYFRLRGHEGMGFGDVKLMLMVGAFLGTRLTLLTIFVGSALGSIVGIGLVVRAYLRRRARYRDGRRAWRSAMVLYSRLPVPFGVFLGVAALASSFWGDRVIHWYFHLF
jgi:leader peptidase (prepilin peptidase)/N-methyltransferase